MQKKILSNITPYYDIDLVFKVGGLVIFNPMSSPVPANLTRSKPYEIKQINYDNSQNSMLTRQVIIIEDDNGNIYLTNGVEVVKYDTYLIFRTMGTLMNLIYIHTGKKVKLPS